MQHTNGRDPILAFRCPAKLYAAILKLAKDQERTASQVGRLALSRYLIDYGRDIK